MVYAEYCIEDCLISLGSRGVLSFVNNPLRNQILSSFCHNSKPSMCYGIGEHHVVAPQTASYNTISITSITKLQENVLKGSHKRNVKAVSWFQPPNIRGKEFNPLQLGGWGYSIHLCPAVVFDGGAVTG